MASTAPAKVLVLCTGNSARSILGEYLLRSRGGGRFEAYSAGSHPTGRVHPLARRVLSERYGIDASSARSKSWTELEDMEFDYLITVCGHARESCPHWPGRTIRLHWGLPDPADPSLSETEAYDCFVEVARRLTEWTDRFCALSDAERRDETLLARIASL